jgi:hypothetical protein
MNLFARAAPWLRKNGVNAGLEVLFNFVLPFVIFSLAKPGLGDVYALMASSAAPIAWTAIELIRKRRLDAVSMLVLAGIALSLLAYLGGGSVKFLQLREKLVTVVIGLVFLVSAAIRRPIIYYLARASSMRTNPAGAAEMESLKDDVHFRRVMTIITLVWGFGLVGEAALASVLVFMLSIKQFLIVSPILGYSVTGALALWTFLYVRERRRIGAARRAAEAAASIPATSGP